MGGFIRHGDGLCKIELHEVRAVAAWIEGRSRFALPADLRYERRVGAAFTRPRGMGVEYWLLPVCRLFGRVKVVQIFTVRPAGELTKRVWAASKTFSQELFRTFEAYG